MFGMSFGMYDVHETTEYETMLTERTEFNLKPLDIVYMIHRIFN